MESSDRTGGCRCGAIRFHVTVDPLVVCHCHCLDCQRSSGAPFVTWAEFPVEAFELVAGSPATHVYVNDSGKEVTRTFCSSCGSPLTYQREDLEATVDVTVTTFEDPGAFEPAYHVWAVRRLPWIALSDGLPSHAKGSQ